MLLSDSFLRGPFTAWTDTQLVKEACRLAPSFQFPLSPHEIYACLPLPDSFASRTLVVLADHARVFPLPPVQCLSTELKHRHGLKLSFYQQAIQTILGGKSYKLPIATSQHALFPLESPHASSTCWLNPAQIQEITETKITTIVSLRNGLTIHTPIRPRSIKRRMVLAFRCHQIIHQAFSPHTALATDWFTLSMTDFAAALFTRSISPYSSSSKGTFLEHYFRHVYQAGYRAHQKKWE